MIDCFDGAIVSWTIGSSPNAELTNTILDQAILTLRRQKTDDSFGPRGSLPLVKLDWANGITSLNSLHVWKRLYAWYAACEGFFGRLKNELFYYENWLDVSIVHFIKLLDDYLEWYITKESS